MIDVARADRPRRPRHVGDREIAAGSARTAHDRAVSSTRRSTTSGTRAPTPERIPRWFLPISGDVRLGGRYQLEGNAGGMIERCDPPRSFAATWEYGGSTSWIEVRVAATPEGGGARFELEHTALVEDGGHWAQFGPGAVGVGWDMGLLGLAGHLGAATAVDPADALAWMASDEGREFMTLSSQRWGEAAIAAGADPGKRAPPRSGRPRPTPASDESSSELLAPTAAQRPAAREQRLVRAEQVAARVLPGQLLLDALAARSRPCARGARGRRAARRSRRRTRARRSASRRRAASPAETRASSARTRRSAATSPCTRDLVHRRDVVERVLRVGRQAHVGRREERATSSSETRPVNSTRSSSPSSSASATHLVPGVAVADERGLQVVAAELVAQRRERAQRVVDPVLRAHHAEVADEVRLPRLSSGRAAPARTA